MHVSLNCFFLIRLVSDKEYLMLVELTFSTVGVIIPVLIKLTQL